MFHSPYADRNFPTEVYWGDPDFDPKQPASYYARVIEIATPRWTAYEAVRYGLEMAEEVPMITRERARTSPIWYTPAGG